MTLKLVGAVWKVLKRVANVPVYYIGCIVPKRDNLWVFGAWFGEKYNDNPKYLFEHVNEYRPEIECVWLSTNKAIIASLRVRGYRAYQTYSLAGYWISMRAAISVVCTGFDDVNEFIPARYIINLWHGIPIKKVVYDDIINYTKRRRLMSRVASMVFPFKRLPSDYSLLVACSHTEAFKHTSAFDIPLEKVKICGMPRHDALFREKIGPSGKRIVYMPTHRREGGGGVGKLIVDDLDNINDSLKKMGAHLFVKYHYYNSLEFVSGRDNVHVLSDDDIGSDVYSVLADYDILITDYSSVFIDYLLTGKPIIFAPFDYEDYVLNDRQMYYDYNDITPGPKCSTWSEVMAWVDRFLTDPSLYNKERAKIRDQFHMYPTPGASSRVYSEIQNATRQLVRDRNC